MRILVLILLFALISNRFLSQTGLLCFEVEYYEANENYTLNLYCGDSLVESKYVEDDEVCFDSLTEGIYNVKTYRDDTLLFHRFNLKVSERKRTTHEIGYYTPYETDLDDTLVNNRFLNTFDYLTSIKQPDHSSLLNREFYFGFLVGESVLISNHAEIGFLGGTSFSYLDFKNDTSYLPLKKLKREHYFSWNYDLAVNFRLSTNNRRKEESKGAFLELGAIYHFPLIFKHVYIENTRKVSTSQLHQFKNVALQARISYENIAFIASYRLFDYVNGSYPELPKLKVGLSFNISE